LNHAKQNHTADQSHLIATKLHPPKLTARFLARAGWPEIIEQVPQNQITILNSSAGSGKTTLLLQINKNLVSLGYRIAWLSLDPDDDQFWRFCDYLVGTLETQGVDMSIAGAVIEDENVSAAHDLILAALSNQLINSHAPLFLILDDFHCIEDKNILQLVSKLITMPPLNFHLVLAARHLTGLTFSKQLSQGTLLEIDSEELHLSEEETGSFIEQMAGQALSSRQLQALQDKTEGWVSALQLVAIALRRHRKPGKYIDSFSGSTQTMAEYLADSVIDSLEPQLQQFLVETSILDNLSDSLCRAVTRIPDDQFPLQKLLDINLFIEPLDDEQTFYRYHSLFRDYLLTRLRRDKTIEVEELHKRARDWYAGNGQYDLAVKHAMVTNSIEDAIDLLDQCALSVLSQGRYRTLIQWMEKLPAEEVRQRVRLQMSLAVSLCLSHRLDDAARLIKGIEDKKSSEQELGEFATVLPILRALELAYHDRFDEAGELAKVWISNKENYLRANPVFSISAFNILAFSLLHQGRFAEVREAFIPLDFLPQKAFPVYGWMLRQTAVGLSWQLEGSLRKALECFENISLATAELLGKRSTTAIQAMTSLAELRYQQGRYGCLFEFIEPNLEVIGETSSPDTILIARLNLACACFYTGKADLAKDVLKKGEAIAIRFSWPRLRLAFQSQRMRFAIRMHEWAEVDILQAELEKAQKNPDEWLAMPADEIRYYIGIAIGERLLEEQDFRKAVRVLKDLCDLLEAKNHTYLGFKVRVPLAIALYSAGNKESALECFHQTLKIAAEEQLAGVFLEQGNALILLLKAYIKTSKPSDDQSLNTLLATLNERLVKDEKHAAGIPVTTAEKQTSVTSTAGHDVRFSSREMEVLELVAQGLTNKHIARALTIGPETVKWHLKNLFSKLDIRSRVDAVQKARRLGMID
jgi:LuxR family maltose regulon positive regulatory protein